MERAPDRSPARAEHEHAESERIIPSETGRAIGEVDPTRIRQYPHAVETSMAAGDPTVSTAIRREMSEPNKLDELLRRAEEMLKQADEQMARDYEYLAKVKAFRLESERRLAGADSGIAASEAEAVDELSAAAGEDVEGLGGGEQKQRWAVFF